MRSLRWGIAMGRAVRPIHAPPHNPSKVFGIIRRQQLVGSTHVMLASSGQQWPTTWLCASGRFGHSSGKPVPHQGSVCAVHTEEGIGGVNGVVQPLCRAVCVVSWLECAGGVRRAGASCCQPNEAAQLAAQRPQLHAQLLTSHDDHWPLMTGYACTSQKKKIGPISSHAGSTHLPDHEDRQAENVHKYQPACVQKKNASLEGNEHDGGHPLCATTTHATNRPYRCV
jgi:hypothetical protein